MVDNKTIRVGYSVWDMLNSAIGTAEPDTVQTNSTEYIELLNSIRTKMSEAHANTLNGILTNPNARNVLMPIILSYVTDYVNNTNDLSINTNRTAERIYQDMAGFGILTPYLNDPTVEEININAWNSITIFWADRVVLLEETFSSPQECVDIIRKMVRIGGTHIDYSQPIIDSFIGDGTRISATLPPVNADQIGATASIRKQTYKNVTREQYISMGFATEKVFDFVDLNVMHNTSVGIAGSPGAGKTTYTTCLLRRFSKNKTTGNKRIVTVEEAREMDLSVYEDFNPSGGHPRLISDTIQWSTKHSAENPITARSLIRHALRYNPAILVPAEMRGGEAMEAVEAGLTGVQIVSTFHAWGAKDGYLRVLSMCQMAGGSASESTIMSQIIQAFPIMVFIKKDDDGVRRIHEVFEATGVKDGAVVGNTIFRFVRRKVIENEEGRIIKIFGEFLQCASISATLRQRLIQHGAKRAVVDQYYYPDGLPAEYTNIDESDVKVEVIESTVEAVVSVTTDEPESFIPTWQKPVVEKEDNSYYSRRPVESFSEEPAEDYDAEEIPSFDPAVSFEDASAPEIEVPYTPADNLPDPAHIEEPPADTSSSNEGPRSKGFWGGINNRRNGR